MKHFVFVLLLALTVAVPSGAQDPGPHEGQPAYCTNHELPDYPLVAPHICECERGCTKDDPEDSKCKVYCRKDHCHCLAECDSQSRRAD